MGSPFASKTHEQDRRRLAKQHHGEMEPLSITTGVISLLGAVGKTTLAVTSFIRSCREARTDHTAVNTELLELQIVLELLRDDSAINENNVFPEALRARVLSAITHCDTIIRHINAVLEKHDTSKSTPIKWVTSGKREVSALQASLETHQGFLNLVLDMINISVSKGVKEDTTIIRSNVAEIKQDTSQIASILEELATVREMIADIRSSPEAAGSNYILQQYLDSLTSYAETVMQDDLSDSNEYSISAVSRKSSLNFREPTPTRGDITSDARQRGPGIEHRDDDTMNMTPVEPKASDDSNNSWRVSKPTRLFSRLHLQFQQWQFKGNRAQNLSGKDIPSLRMGEDDTPGTHNPPRLPSNIAAIQTSEAPEIQSEDNLEAPSTQQLQGNIAFNVTRNVICVGDGLVGKTAFLVKWSQGWLTEIPLAPTFRYYSENRIIDGKSVKFTVMDTPGQDEDERTRAFEYPNQDVVLICFSIINPDSFANIPEGWMAEVRHYGPRIPQTPVSPEEREELRKEIGGFSYLECSAKTSEGMNEVFSAVERACAAVKPQLTKRWFQRFNKS
ncbi:hypothetical protein O1611_g3996 [Lasiodiplodia mahajangana]|uniref:Uncharacterized protein n=1 Tax=Lasiodiplodia mahajangana TaxID=1108764 RepID=A0ACC2JQ48_9PEZI|nr:hypothetical protein O1611_g3996 [Lasiodiplodia mahajangana]